MSRRPVFIILGLLVGLLTAACGGDGGSDSDAGSESASDCKAPFQQPFSDVQAYPVFANTESAVGENRFLVGIQNTNDAPMAAPEINVSIEFYDLNSCPTEPSSTEDMEFFWTIKPVVGLYRTIATFDKPGIWGAEVTISGGGVDEKVKGSFEVRPESSTPALGSTPPASDSPTADDAKDLAKISTDENPDPAFYEVSIAEALKAGKPFVVVFATPKFCQSQTCGPTLDNVKDVAKDFPKITFIHVEPYVLPADPSNLQAAPTGVEWGLPSEPWVFVMDEKGKVVAKYEGAIAPEELEEALQDF